MRCSGFGDMMAFGAALVVASTALAAESRVQLRVLETTDIHSHVLNYDYYRDLADDGIGLSKVATLARQARGEVPNSLLIDNGDLIQGNPLGDYIAKFRGVGPDKVHPVYKAMNLIGYDVGNIGNHEFNYGLDYLAETLKGAAFPYVNANVYHPDGTRNYFTPYVILDRLVKDTAGTEHSIRIGVIGFVPPQVMQWDKINLDGRVVARDIVETARRFVPELKAKGADLVIAVPHSGMGQVAASGPMQENAAYALSRVPGVDAILFGHSHLIFPSPAFKDLPGVDLDRGTVNGIPAVMPGFWGSHLGLVDFDLAVDGGRWRVVRAEASARPVFRLENRRKVPLVDNDPGVVAAVKQDHEDTLAFIRSPIGRALSPIYSYFALVQDDPSIQIVTDAQAWYVRRLLQGTEHGGLAVLSAGAPFKAGGRSGSDFYTDVPAGQLSVKSAADLYLYPNTLQAVLVTGAEVREWLEMSAGIFNRIDPARTEPQALLDAGFPSYNFDVIDGVRYEIDLRRPRRYDNDGKVVAPNSHRIVNLTFEGRPIQEDRRFVVVTNNYRASGGGKFPGLDGGNVILQAPDENRTVLMNYIMEKKEVEPKADGNWRFAPLGRPVTVSFESSPAAARLLEAGGPIELLGPGENGFARYGLKLD